jgi:hypothetical protein
MIHLFLTHFRHAFGYLRTKAPLVLLVHEDGRRFYYHGFSKKLLLRDAAYDLRVA